MQALASSLLVVVALYFGREILIPLAMAVLLTFLLTPLVDGLERRRFPRILAVLLVLGVIAVIGGAATWIIGNQFATLAADLPEYQQNLKEKLLSLNKGGKAFSNVQETINEVTKATQDSVTQTEDIHSVRIVPDEIVPTQRVSLLTNTVLTPLANAAIIVVLLLFMLLNREDMRNRIVRLAGKRLTLTTRTLDQIGTRISRYLLASSMINGTFGLVVAGGLYWIGVHYALMWGFLAGVLRFVPYVGPLLGATLPITMAFIQFPGDDWQHLAMTVAMFVVLELITNNVAEPLLYGQSAGVSTVALLVSVTFWTWVWGPMGLVLAVPLTVVMAVLGEYVPPLQPLGILLGDKPPLAAFVSYYQRLLAADVEEAATIVEEQHKSGGLLQVYDHVLLPALVLAEKDCKDGDLLGETQEFIWQTTQEFMEDLTPPPAADGESEGPGLRARVLGVPAHDESDVLALAMLQQLVPLRGGRLEVLSTSMLVSETLSRLADDAVDAVLISSLGPVGVRQTRGLVKKLRQAHPYLPIIIGRWGFQGDRERMIQGLKDRGADQVITTLAEAREVLLRQHTAAEPASKASV